jgi:hypothetical protein
MLCEQPERDRIELGVAFTAVSPRASRTVGVPAIGFDLSWSDGFDASHDALKLPAAIVLAPERILDAGQRYSRYTL